MNNEVHFQTGSFRKPILYITGDVTLLNYLGRKIKY